MLLKKSLPDLAEVVDNVPMTESQPLQKLVGKKEISRELFKVCRINGFENLDQIEAYFEEHGSFDLLERCSLTVRRELESLLEIDLRRLASTWNIPAALANCGSVVRIADFLMHQELLTNGQMENFKAWFQIYKGEKPLSPYQVSEQRGIALNNLRHQRRRMISEVWEKLLSLKCIKDDLQRNYGLDPLSPLIVIDDALTGKINAKVKTNFTPAFLGFLLGAYLEEQFSSVGGREEVLSGNFVGSRYYWTRFYLVKKKLAAALDIETLVQESARLCRSADSGIRSLHFNPFVSHFIRVKDLSASDSEVLFAVAGEILFRELGLKPGKDGKLLFQQKTEAPLGRYCCEALQALGEVSSPSAIRSKIEELQPTVFVDPQKFAQTLLAEKAITGYKGLYGLRSWFPKGDGSLNLQDPGLLKEIREKNPKKDSEYWRAHWEQRCEELKEFVETEARLPKKRGNAAEKSLSIWLGEQLRKDKAKLDSWQQELLEEILKGFPVTAEEKRKAQWVQKLEELYDFTASHKRLPRTIGDVQERRLYGWFWDQKGRIKKRKLPYQQQALIEEFERRYPFQAKNKERDWDENFSRLKAFLKEHSFFPKTTGSPEEIRLYKWYKEQERRLEAGELDRKQHLGINEVAVYYHERPVPGALAPWEERFEEIEKFAELHSRLPQRGAANKKERSMGLFLHNQLHRLRHGKLTPERETLLKNLKQRYPFNRKIHWKVDWDERLEEVRQFAQAHGAPPGRTGTKEELTLNTWIRQQHRRLKAGNLNLHQQTLLKEFEEQYPFKSERYWREYWEEKFAELETFAQTHLRLPLLDSSGKEKLLYRWFISQRQTDKKRKLSVDQQKRVNELFYRYRVRSVSRVQAEWDERFEALRDFFATHSRIPKQGCKKERPLRTWFLEQQRRLKKRKLDARQQKLIKQLVAKYPYKTHFEEHWDNRFRELQRFVEANNQLPQAALTAEKSLHQWLRTQQLAMTRGNLYSQQQMRLEELLEPFREVEVDWKERLHQVWDFCETHGRPPKRTAETEEEKLLNAWFTNQKQKAKKGRLDPRQEELLGELVKEYNVKPGQFKR